MQIVAYITIAVGGDRRADVVNAQGSVLFCA